METNEINILITTKMAVDVLNEERRQKNSSTRVN